MSLVKLRYFSSLPSMTLDVGIFLRGSMILIGIIVAIVLSVEKMLKRRRHIYSSYYSAFAISLKPADIIRHNVFFYNLLQPIERSQNVTTR